MTEIYSDEEKKLKKILNNRKFYYKNNPEVIKIINLTDVSLKDKCNMIKEYTDKFKKCKSYYKESDIMPEKLTVEYAQEFIYNEKMKKYYEKQKKEMVRRYYDCPEYKSSLNLRHYKKYIDIHPEVKSIFENEELTKVQKLEHIREFIKKLPTKSS